MAPFSPEHRNNESSESDEEGNSRHDRFKSERFQSNTSYSRSVPRSEENVYQSNRLSDRRHRDRSPPRNYNYKDTCSSSFAPRESRRNDHDQKDKERKHHSRTFRSDKTYERSRQESKRSKYSENEEDEEPVKKTNKNKLSSLLKNFDKQAQSKLANVNSETEIGPALPPNLIEKSKANKDSDSNYFSNDDSMLGPSLSSHLKSIHEASDNEFGVALPPHLKHKHEQTESESSGGKCTASSLHLLDSDEVSSKKDNAETQQSRNESESESNFDLETKNVAKFNEREITPLIEEKKADVFGPVLPPKVEIDSYGPALPPTFKKETIQGPTLPSGMTSEQLELMAQEESDEDTVGPLPEGKMTMTQYQLDLRASHLKRKLEEEKNGSTTVSTKREEWMLELPPEKATNLGLGPRSFRMKEAPDMSNRSSWTDTPADKQRKEEMALRGEVEPVNHEEISRAAFIRERDEAMDKMSKKSREEDRPQSLLELHQKKIKKKKKKEEKEGKKKERRPFDRNIDLQVNRFDDAQKKAIFKKAQLLDTRFSTGESKYL